MSIARNILLVSASVVAVGMAVAMATDGDIDWLRRSDWIWSAYRSIRPAPPVVIATPPPRAPAPAPAAEPVPETVVVTLPSANIPSAIDTRPIAGEQLSLAQELQGELQRVGCYGGTIDGLWTPLSQKSMRAFMEAVNAQLPVNEPDYVLLALVRGRKGTVCSKPCLPELGLNPNTNASCLVAKPGPERAPSVLPRSTVATTPSAPVEARPMPASPAANPAAVVAAVPGQPGSLPGVAPLVPPQKAKKAQRKPEPGLFGTGIFKTLFAGGY